MKGTSYDEHKKIMREIIGKSSEHHRKIIGEPREKHRETRIPQKTMGKQWHHIKTTGKPSENHGKP